MSDGNVDRLNFVFCPQGNADRFVFINHRRDASPLFAQVRKLSDQHGFRHADGWNVSQQADVTGDTEFARVRQTLPVAQDNVGRDG